MKAFAALIDRLIYTRSRNSKLALIVDYLRHTPDPDRGWAIAALTESLDFPAVKAGTVRALLATRIDEQLFRLSRHFVGDTAETAALLSDAGTGTPYDGARPHYMLDIDNAALLDVLIPVLAACTPLPKPRKKKVKA